MEWSGGGKEGEAGGEYQRKKDFFGVVVLPARRSMSLPKKKTFNINFVRVYYTNVVRAKIFGMDLLFFFAQLQ